MLSGSRAFPLLSGSSAWEGPSCACLSGCWNLAVAAGDAGMDHSPGKVVVHTDQSVCTPPEYSPRVLSCKTRPEHQPEVGSHLQFMQQSSSFKYKQSCINKKEKKKRLWWLMTAEDGALFQPWPGMSKEDLRIFFSQLLNEIFGTESRGRRRGEMATV